MNTHSIEWNLTILMTLLSYVNAKEHESFKEAIAKLLIWNIDLLKLFKP